MKRSVELEVGEILHRKNGKAYEVVASARCEHCAFEDRSAEWCASMVCGKDERKDGISVIFIRRKGYETFF